MGHVYAAHAPDGRQVAIKVIRPEWAADPEFRQRFRSEIRRAQQVPSFCTAEVIDADLDHATPYLVVEYVEGPTLAEVVQIDGPLNGGTLHSVAVGVATALAAIHGAGVVHRDLKPANVLLAPVTPKVIDFGIARALDSTSELTRSDRVVGTIAYMAPERFDTGPGARAGPEADVFAWGVLVAFAATGRTPFAAGTQLETVGRILTQPPDLAGLTGLLRDLVAAALGKDPAARPTASALLDRLLGADGAVSDALDDQPALRLAAEAMQRTGRHALARRRVTQVLTSALLLAVTVGATGAAVHFNDVARSQSDAVRQQATTVREQARVLAGQGLLARSTSARASDPGLAVRSAMAAYRIGPGPTSRAALTAALATRFAAEPATTTPTTTAQYRPDGQAVATAGADGSVVLWIRSVDGALTRASSVASGPRPVNDIGFSPDGSTLATIGNGLQLWDVRQLDAPRLRATYPLDWAEYQGVSFTRDGRNLLVDEGTVISLRPVRRAGTATWSLRGPGGNPTAVATIDPSGRYLVGSVWEEHLSVWQLRGPRPPRLLATMRDIGQSLDVALSPNGRTMAVAQHGSVGLYDMSDPARPARLGALTMSPDAIASAVTFDHQGSRIAAAGSDRVVTLWDVATPREPALIATMRGHGGSGQSVQFSRDDARLLTASLGFAHTVLEWHTRTALQAERTRARQSWPRYEEPRVAFSEPGTLVALSANGVTTWDVNDPSRPRRGRTTVTLPKADAVTPVRVTPGHRMVLDGGVISSVGRDGRAKRVMPPAHAEIWVGDMNRTGTLAAVLDGSGRIQLYALSADGKATRTATLPGRLPDPLVSFAGSGELFVHSVAFGHPPRIDVWALEDQARPRLVRSMPLRQPGSLLATDSSGMRVAVIGRDSVDVYYQPHTEPLRVPAGGPDNAALHAALSADGSIIAVATTAGTELWSIEREAPPVLLQTIAGPAEAVAFSDTLDMLAVAGEDAMTVWDVRALSRTVKDPLSTACQLGHSGLTRPEWNQYAPGVPYQPVCP